MYRLILRDKGHAPFSLEHPEAFLSEKSIHRRARQGLEINLSDLPIDPAYFDAVRQTGASIRAFSKWVNTIVVHIPQDSILSALAELPFVDTLYCVWKGKLPEPELGSEGKAIGKTALRNDINSYGSGFTQIKINNGHLLHEAGFRGKGMTVAVMDGGFPNVDILDFFDADKILEVKNFNHEVNDPKRSSVEHGTRVLSCMLSDKSGELIGTAPEASYYLFRTEVDKEEFPVEEDYWVAALEYADSIGVDVVTTSLGYSNFDKSEMDHTQEQLDGKTIPMSEAANLAASKGMLLFNSAGNERAKNWGKITIPSDAENIITVGSIAKDSILSSFSSYGYSADGRVKPDLTALGTSASVLAASGYVITSNGTSFSTPILAGMATCLWEALPDLTTFDMLKLLRETGDRFANPDSLYGYGVANVYKAYTNKKTSLTPVVDENSYLSVNSYENRLYINSEKLPNYARCILNIYSAVGTEVLSGSDFSNPIDITPLPRGIYIARLKIDNRQFVRKFVKLR
jgi:subtilisin family serine protease